MNPQNVSQYAMAPHGAASLLAVIIVVTIALLYQAYVPQTVTLISSGYGSEAIRARIAAHITLKHLAVLPINALYAEIKKVASSISDITVVHDRPCNVTLLVNALTPCAIVNNKDILTANGSIVPLEEYGSDTIKNLAHITVLEPFFCERSRVMCSAWIAKLPVKILQSFSLVWYARSHIELVARDTNVSRLVFITWCYTDFSPEIMAAMERVAQHNKRIDLRVPHYAIVSPILRGNL